MLLDGRIRRWAQILKMDGRCLRVVLLEDGETIHTAFLIGASRNEDAIVEAKTMIQVADGVSRAGPYVIVRAAGFTVGYALGAAGACAVDRSYYSLAR